MDFINKAASEAQETVETEVEKQTANVKTQVGEGITEAMSGLGLKGDGSEGGMKGKVQEGVNQALKSAGLGDGAGTRAAPACGKGRPPAQSDAEFDRDVEDGIKADVRMFSGCEDKQTSADVHDVAKFGLPDAKGAGGACTNAVLVNLKDHKPDTWMSLLKGMRSTLRGKKFSQVPQLSTSRQLDINQPFSLSGGEGGNHKALLIGINYTGMGAGELKGCHNDVASMKDFIPEYGYSTEEGPNLKIILDDGEHEDPTRVNITRGIKWLIHGAKAGDSLFMHYSGHGGSVRDSTGDEADNKDETMVPMDYARAGQIKDDEILATLVTPLPAGVTLTVVMDCCHSGSILDLPYSFNADDNSLQAVDGGAPTVVKKKNNFNMRKMKRAQGKKN